MKKPVTTDSPASQPENTSEKPKKALTVLPSHGEPCEGTTSSGDNCGFGSEYYLLNAEGQKSAWCKTHLDNILSAYATANYTVGYGMGENR